MSHFDEKEMLSAALHERAQDVQGRSVSMEAVTRSAVRIRRRRRVATGLAVAAALAVVVPTGLALTSGQERLQGPVDIPRPTATEEPTPTPVGDVRLTLDGLPRGADPQVTYLADHEVVTPDGRVRTPISYQQITPYGAGWLALGYQGQGSEIFVLDAAMQPTRSFSSGQSFAVSSDGGRIAYVRIESDGSQTLVNDPAGGGEAERWSFPRRPTVTPVGFVAADTVLYESEENIGLASPGGRLTELDGFVNVTDANMANGLVAGQTRSDLVRGSCWGVMDPAVSTSRMVWETCDHSLGGFSPDGRLLIGSIPDYDGMGAPTLSILDATTGDPVVSYLPDRDSQITLPQRTWEGSDTVLAVAMEGTNQTIVRVDTSGEVEEAVEPVEAQPYHDVPFWFSTAW